MNTAGKNIDRVMIVAAHPDDDILGCGGTLAKLTEQGADVKVIFIGEGTTARYDLKDINSQKARYEIEYRYNCAKKALACFNIANIRFFNLPSCRMDTVPLIDIGKIIEREINEYKPDTVFTHSNIDTNNDHTTVFQATLQATRPQALNFVPRVYLYEVLSSSEWRFIENFRPNSFMALEERHVERKIAAMNQYDSEFKEFPYPRSIEGIKTLAKYRGMQAGCKFAESFCLLREVIR